MYFTRECILNKKKREERGKHSRGRGTWTGPVVCDRVSLRGRRREKDEKHTRGRKHRAKCVLGHGGAPQGPHASTSHCRKPPSRLPPPALIIQPLFYWSCSAWCAVLLFCCSTVLLELQCLVCSSTVLLFYCSTATAVLGELHMGPSKKGIVSEIRTRNSGVKRIHLLRSLLKQEKSLKAGDLHGGQEKSLEAGDLHGGQEKSLKAGDLHGGWWWGLVSIGS